MKVGEHLDHDLSGLYLMCNSDKMQGRIAQDRVDLEASGTGC